MARLFLVSAALSGMLAVMLGAFGAHGLKIQLSAELMAVYQTAVQYHFYHSLALLAVGVMAWQVPSLSALRWSGYLFLFGMTVFSGSLYLLAVSGIRWLGAITPIGGVAMVAGWLLLAWAGYQWPRSNK